jgi:hypothetical protein
MTARFDPDEKTLGIIEGLAKIQCTQGEAAAVLGIVRSTFVLFLKRDKKARQRWENALDSGKASLRRNQFKLSENNAAMAIWLGKQYLGQREPVRYEEEHPEVPLGKKEIAQRAAEQAHEGNSWSSLVQ